MIIMSPRVTKKKSSARTTKLVGKKTTQTPADYIKVGTHTYERISTKSVEVEMDLAEDVLKTIDSYIVSGKYVSRGDAIRDILRRVIESEGVLK